MASNEQSFERNDDNNSQNERDSVESESYIDQTVRLIPLYSLLVVICTLSINLCMKMYLRSIEYL